MRSYRLYLSVLGLSLAGIGLGQQAGTTSVTASAGYVAAMNSGTGVWTGLAGTASTSSIQFSNSTTQLKFNTGSNGDPTAKNFGTQSSMASGVTNTTTGNSNVSNAGNSGAPTYYSAQWTSASSTSDPGTVSVGGGTYDPWTVTYGDIQRAGAYSSFGTESLYYQTSLVNGLFDLRPDQVGSYNFSLSVSNGAQTLDFVDLTVRSDETVDLSFGTYENFSIYLLGAYANVSPRQTIQDRLAGGTLLTQQNGASIIKDYLLRNLNDDGSLTNPLNFGLVYSGVPLPSNPNSSGTVLGFHSDTTQKVSAVPGPGSAAVFGLLMIRRSRKRRS